MAARGGKPWSGANPIPNIQKFVESLDKDKKERDRQIDEQNKLPEQQHQGEVKPHKNAPKQTGGKTVTDPTTGKEVVIEDVGKDFMKAVEDPLVFLLHVAPIVPDKSDISAAICAQRQSWKGNRVYTHGSQCFCRLALTCSSDCQNGANAIQPRIQGKAGYHCTSRSYCRGQHLRRSHTWRKN